MMYVFVKFSCGTSLNRFNVDHENNKFPVFPPIKSFDKILLLLISSQGNRPVYTKIFG
ncbi:prophage pi1 protein 12 [Lactococcus lactis subsp. lactis IO-1]|nr:prophage pi1 protein 12 [Lactococcus lactis subsp. lactis IO-1]